MSTEVWLADFGREVRAARQAKGWSVRDLGAMVGLSRSAISNIEAGRYNTKGSTVAHLASVLGIELPPWYLGEGRRRQLSPSEIERLRRQLKEAHERR